MPSLRLPCCIFALAAVAALSLGIGTAMAESDGASAPDPNYGTNQQFYQPAAPASRQMAAPAAIQSGSSDVDTLRPAAPVVDQLHYGEVANPG